MQRTISVRRGQCIKVSLQPMSCPPLYANYSPGEDNASGVIMSKLEDDPETGGKMSLFPVPFGGNWDVEVFIPSCQADAVTVIVLDCLAET